MSKGRNPLYVNGGFLHVAVTVIHVQRVYNFFYREITLVQRGNPYLYNGEIFTCKEILPILFVYRKITLVPRSTSYLYREVTLD